jgi:hypothetical protein
MGEGMGLLAAAFAVMGCGATMRAETRAERCGRIVRSDPVFVSGEAPVYTQAALDAGVHGPVRAKCFISDQGIPLYCTLIDRVASMNDSLIHALGAIRYKPALVDGSPTMVSIEVTVQLKLPPPGWSPPPPDPTNKVLPFGTDVERPRRLAGAKTVFPVEERSSCNSGLVLARCVLTKQGKLVNCGIVASTSPFLSKAVIDVLPSYRYTPATFQGKAVDTVYTIPFKFELE